jgi:hypothetical protein
LGQVQRFTANTYARAVFCGFTQFTIIVDTMRRIPGSPVWRSLPNYGRERAALETALRCVLKRPYIGYDDHGCTSLLRWALFPLWFEVCKAISIEVFGERGLANLVTKTGGKADNSLVRTCVMVAHQSMANDARSVFDTRPQDALDGIASLLSVISEVRSSMVFVQY